MGVGRKWHFSMSGLVKSISQAKPFQAVKMPEIYTFL